MGWRDWKYWMKGALLFCALHIIITLSFILWIILMDYIVNPSQGTNYAGLGIVLSLILGFVTLVPAVIVGLIVGLIYGSYKTNPSSIKIIILITLIVLFFSIYVFYFSRF